MFQDLINQFTSSAQGQTALSRLTAQGFAPHQANAFMGAALPTAAHAFHQVQLGGAGGQRPGGPQGIMDVAGGHYCTNFLSGAVTSLIRGEGLMGAASGGLQGLVGGHIAQVIARQFGLPQRVAGTAGAIITPLAIDWLWSRVQGDGLNLAQIFDNGTASAQPAGSIPSGGGWGGGSSTASGFSSPNNPGAFGVSSQNHSPTIANGIGSLLSGLFNA